MYVLFLVLNIFCVQQQNILHIYADHLLSLWAWKQPQLGEEKRLVCNRDIMFSQQIFWHCNFNLYSKRRFIQVLCCYLQRLGMSWGCLNSDILFLKGLGKSYDCIKAFREDPSMGWHATGWHHHLKSKLCELNIFWAIQFPVLSGGLWF